MTRQSLLAAICAAAISCSAMSLAEAGQAVTPSHPAKTTTKVHRASPGTLRQSYNRLQTARDAVPASTNLFETGRPPAQPGQW